MDGHELGVYRRTRVENEHFRVPILRSGQRASSMVSTSWLEAEQCRFLLGGAFWSWWLLLILGQVLTDVDGSLLGTTSTDASALTLVSKAVNLTISAAEILGITEILWPWLQEPDG